MNQVLTRRNFIEVYDDAGIVNLAITAFKAAQPFESREAAQAARIPSWQSSFQVRVRGQIITYYRDATGTAITTADGGTWTQLRTGARYQSIAWGDGWEGVWKCWEWQRVQRGRIDLEIPPGVSVVQPTDGTSASRRLVALNIPINFANFGIIVRMSTEPVIAVSAGYINPVAVTNIVESTTTVTLPEGEDGEGGTTTEVQEVTTITLASLAGYEATTGLVAYITDDDMTPLNPDGSPVTDGGGNPVTPGIPEHIVRRRGENFVIWRAEAGTSGSPRTDLVVRKPLNFYAGGVAGKTYNLSANCRVWLLRNTEIEIHAGNVEDGNPREPGDPAFNPIIHIEAAKNPRVHSLRCEYSGAHIVQFLQCYEPVFKDFTIGYIANQNNPWHAAGLARYGARFVNCAKGQVSDGLAGHGRHVVDFLSLTYTGFSYLKPDASLHPIGSGASMDCTVTDVTSWGATAPPFSTHDGTFRIKFANCHAIKPASWGFASRGVGHVFDGCSDVDANGVIHCFVGGRYIGRGTAITRDITLRNHTSVNPRGLGLFKLNDGCQSFLSAGWVVRFTEDGSGAIQRLGDIRTGADVSISGLRMEIRRAQGMDELFKITGSGTAGAIRLTDSEVIDWTGTDAIDYLVDNEGPAYLHMVSGVRAYRGDAQQQLIMGLYTGTAPAAGSHIRDSRIVGLWSEDEVAPDRATVLAAYVSPDRAEISYLDGSRQVDLVRDASGLAATIADGSKWNPKGSDAPLFAFGASVAAANNGPAWQAAFNWMAQAPGRRIVEYSGRTYGLQSGATTTANFHVEGDFRLLATADISILSAVAPVQEIVALTANYSPGDLTLSVATMSAAIAPGRWIKLLSDAVNPLSRDAGPAAGPSTNRARCGRWIQVGSGSTTTSIALVKALSRVAGIDAYSGSRVNAWTTAYAARVAVPQVRYGTLKGISWAYEDGHGDSPNQWSGQAITVSGYIAPLFDRVSSDLGYGPAISLGGTVNAVVENCDFRNLKSAPSLGQYGYGVHDTGYGTRVIGLTGERCRHVYTTGQSTSPEGSTDPEKMWRMGNTVGSVVNFADVAGGQEDAEIILSPLDTHHGAEDVQFNACRVSNCGSALNNRGVNTVVTNLTVRGAGRAVYCFTERQDGDGYPLTAGKLVEDFASMTVVNLDAETTGSSVETTTAKLLVRDARIRSCSRGVFVTTGGLSLAGDIDVTIDTLDGAAAAVVNGDYNQPGVIAPKSNLEPDRTLMGEPIARILPGTSLRIDARVAGPAGAANRLVSQITSVGAPDVYGRVINEGLIDLLLPADGVLWSQDANIECRGEGVIRYDCSGAADTVAAIVGGSNVLPARNVKVISHDGSVYWDRATRQWPGERLVFSNGNIGITHSGASANTSLYTPPQDIVPYLVAGDSLRVELVFRKTGTSGTAVVAVNTSGQSNNDTYTMPAEASFMRLTMIMDVTGAASQDFLFDWQGGLNSSDPDPQRVQARQRTITQSGMTYAFRVGAPAMSGSDSIILNSCRIWCTAGGGKVS